MLEDLMSKYQKLTVHLTSLEHGQWMAQFKEIEAILGFPLPKSAYTYPAWWSNQASDGHSQSGSWQSIGWRTRELDLSNQRVTFVRITLVRQDITFARQEPDCEEHLVANVVSIMKHNGGLTIAEAKAGLSIYFGVVPESIEITIKG
jgi:hypothetical protein